MSTPHEDFVRETCRHFLDLILEYEIHADVETVFTISLDLTDGRKLKFNMTGDGTHE